MLARASASTSSLLQQVSHSRRATVRCLACSAPFATRVTRSRPPVRAPRHHKPSAATSSCNHEQDRPIAGSDIWQQSAQQPEHASTSANQSLRHSSEPAHEQTTLATTATADTTTIQGNLPLASRLPVHVPHDELGIVDKSRGLWADKLKDMLANPAIVVCRELEMMNVLVGYEQANKYRIMSPEGSILGYLVEEDLGFGKAIARQAFKTHRSFKATVLDTEGNVIMIVRRPFSWINSRIYACTPAEHNPNEPDKVIGEAQQEWHLWRRKYNLFQQRGAIDKASTVEERDGNNNSFEQFAETNEGFLAWDFVIRNEKGEAIASISRNFSGIARELFTDTGQYVIRFEAVQDQLASLPSGSDQKELSAPSATPAAQSANSPTTTGSAQETKSHTAASIDDKAIVPMPSIPYDQRAVLLACAVTVDFDYFSRDRGGAFGSGFMSPMIFPFPMGGGGGGGAAGETAEGGVAEAGAGGVSETDSDHDGLPRNDERYGGEDRGGGWGAQPDETSPFNNDEVMQDPWSDNQGQQEGGTWGWGDLFPGDSEDGGADGGDW
ncbi:hypothetical protein OIO90_005773 [Microbotryomycetes sp. JL221]|nr:hypothetical protein OIO90_005773 [Microbotryomycetes sp. JL221]